MTKEERHFEVLSNECKAGNHQDCTGKLNPLSGVENCQCTHHQNTPIYVDDTPVSNGTV